MVYFGTYAHILFPAFFYVLTYRMHRRILKHLEHALNAPRTSTNTSPPPLTPLHSSVATETLNDDDFLKVRHYNFDSKALSHMYARDWCYDKTLVVLDEKMDMRTALGQMHDSKANCALLYSSENVLLGTLDTRDIIRLSDIYVDAQSTQSN